MLDNLKDEKLLVDLKIKELERNIDDQCQIIKDHMDQNLTLED